MLERISKTKNKYFGGLGKLVKGLIRLLGPYKALKGLVSPLGAL